MRIRLLVLLLLVSPLHAAPPLRILFIGNSLTYTNDLPAMVRQIGALDGRRIATEMIALPNYSLEDHLATGSAKKALAKKWDIVVLQQGPSSLGESRAMLIRDVKLFAALIPDATRIAVLMVWPARERWRALPSVMEAHRLAAEAISGELIPAGRAFDAALQQDAKLALFDRDGFHPSETGSYLAALTTYRTLVGPLPRALTKSRDAKRRILLDAVNVTSRP